MASQPHNQRWGTRSWWMRVLLAVEVVLLTLMIIAFFGRLVIQRMVNEGIKSATLLDPYTPNSTWNRMVRNDLPGAPADMLYAFMYNITNLPEVHKGAKPHLDEVGPYVFRKIRVKEHVRFGRDGHVYYREFITFKDAIGCDAPAAAADTHSTSERPNTIHSSTPVWPGYPTGRRGGFAGADSGPPVSPEAERVRGAQGVADSGITPGRLGPPRCPRDDVITTLNLPLLGVLRAVDEVSPFKAFVEVAIKQFFIQHQDSGKFDGLFMHRTAQQLLFGYDDELISAIAHLVPSLAEKAFFTLIPNMTTPEDAFPQNIMSTRLVRRPPDAPARTNDAGRTPVPGPARHLQANPDTRPLSGGRDGAADAAAVVIGGGDCSSSAAREQLGEGARGPLHRPAELWQKVVLRPVRRVFDALNAWAKPELPGWSYVEWQGHDAVSCWAGGHVERVAGGSDALQFPPGLTHADPIYVYVPELFRMARLNVTGEVDVRGVRLLQFKPDDRVAAPDPRFFTEITGLMNVSACTAVGPDGSAAAAAGPPVLMSFPHFCHVDPAVAAQTTGVSPCNQSLHDLWLGVEPHTGITMAARKRLQVSSAFDGRHAAFDPGARPTILPIFWAEEAGELGEEQAAHIRGQLYPALQAVRVLEGRPLWLSLWTVAVALLCTLAILAAWRPLLARSAEPACSESQDEAPLSNGQRPSLAAAAAAAAAAQATSAAASSRGAAESPPRASSDVQSCEAASAQQSRLASPQQAPAAAARAEEGAEAADASGEAAVQPSGRDEGGSGALPVPVEAALPYQLEVAWGGGPLGELRAGVGSSGPPEAAPQQPGSPTWSIRSSRLGSEAVRSHVVRIDSD